MELIDILREAPGEPVPYAAILARMFPDRTVEQGREALYRIATRVRATYEFNEGRLAVVSVVQGVGYVWVGN
jgi:hypothetical protein